MKPTISSARPAPDAAEPGSNTPPLPGGDARVAQMETIISAVLRYGVLLSFAILVAGVALLFVEDRTGYTGAHLRGHGALSSLTNYHAVSQNVRWPTTPGETMTGLAHGQPFAIIALGLLVLIATPVLRVAASVVTFLWERDRLYAAITAYVLAVLLVSFVIGKGG